MIGYTVLILTKEINKLKEIKETILTFLKKDCLEDDKLKEIDEKILELENSITQLTKPQEESNDKESVH